MKKPDHWPPKDDRIAIFKSLLRGPKTWAELREIAGDVGAIVIVSKMKGEGLLLKRKAFDPIELKPEAVRRRLAEP